MLGSLTIYLKGMRRMMFQLSGFYCRSLIDPFKEPLGALILYLKGMRRMMFQLSGFYCKFRFRVTPKP